MRILQVHTHISIQIANYIYGNKILNVTRFPPLTVSILNWNRLSRHIKFQTMWNDTWESLVPFSCICFALFTVPSLRIWKAWRLQQELSRYQITLVTLGLLQIYVYCFNTGLLLQRMQLWLCQHRWVQQTRFVYRITIMKKLL